jgi:surfactin synthase thioesterase subunit
MSLPSGYNRWCRRYRPAAHAAVRLVCFPHAGGSAPFYLPMAAALSPGVDVVAIQYPGRQERRAERPIADLMVLADRICDVLGGQPEMPMTFFGHSMGALVAFEVARRLEADGHGPSRLNGTNSAVFADEELMRATLPALRADCAAAEGYSCAPQIAVSCPISILVGDNDPKARLADARAWVGHTTGAFDLKVFPGGHFFLADRADEIMKILDRHFRIERDRIVA